MVSYFTTCETSAINVTVNFYDQTRLSTEPVGIIDKLSSLQVFKHKFGLIMWWNTVFDVLN